MICMLAWPVSRRHRAIRVTCVGCVYFTVDLVVVATCLWYWLRRVVRRMPASRWRELHRDLLDWALTRLAKASHRLLGFRLDITDPPDADALDGNRPVLVLARHAGPGDSLAVVHLLLGRYRRDVRIVLKDLLTLDPGVDILLTRLHCVFLPSRNTAGTSA